MTEFIVPIFGPTAITSGEFTCVLSGCCNNQPSGKLNVIPYSSLSNFWLPVDGVIGVVCVRSGSDRARRFET